MDTNKLSQFTLVDVINRKAEFTTTNTIYDKTEFHNDNQGALMAFSEMLEDIRINEMAEDEFVTKYLHIIHTISAKFENDEYQHPDEVAKMSGYNNAIVSVLTCINPIYEFEVEE